MHDEQRPAPAAGCLPHAAEVDPQLCAAALVRSAVLFSQRSQGVLHAEGVCVCAWKGGRGAHRHVYQGPWPVPAA
mgnify:CR=1 FL=1